MKRNRFDPAPAGEDHGAAFSAVIFAVILAILLYGISSVSNSISSDAATTLENAVRQKTVACYALEGFYPPSLRYLTEHYGLTYDSDRFVVDYQPVAENLMPEITVIDLKSGSTGKESQ